MPVTAYDRISNEILDFLEKNPGATEGVVLAGIHGKQSLKSGIVRQLIGGAVRREGTGHKGDPYRYFPVQIEIENAPIVASASKAA
jgi:hypothetical protein